MKRRPLDLRSCQEVVAEIESIASTPYQQLGKWNLTQACQHLTATMKGGMEGFGFRFPWILRVTVAKWGFDYGLKKRKMFAGMPTIRPLKPTAPGDEDNQEIIQQCIETCQAVAVFRGEIKDYPLLNHVETDDWRDFMWVHASHHLGFLVPDAKNG
ncbi:MAG: DUF1569 domain-containing protein [Planctomycetota bacterium]